MMLKSVERDQLDREVVEMRDMRRSRLLTCALSAVVAGILVVPATALAVGEAGTVTDDVEMTEPVSTDSQNEADNELITVGEGEKYSTILEALQQTDASGTEPQTRTVKLVGDITSGPGFSVFEHDTLTIDLNGHTLTLADTANISVAGNLTVKDDAADAQNPQVDEENGSVTYGVQGAIILGGSSTVSATGSGAHLKLDSGTVRSFAHGCIRVSTGAAFEMTGGLIDSTDGFAVEVNDGGSFEMTGGVAKATNYSAVMGDDNFRRGNTQIQIDGGYILSVSDGEPVGAGVCQVMDGGILQMDSGTIRAVGKGVGVIVEYGSFRLNDGEIYGDGTSFDGQTAGRVSVDKGYGLVLYSVEAGTEINGGFISGMKDEKGAYPVPSVDIADAASTYGVSTMSLDLGLEPVNKGVSIKGGTYTNFDGLDPAEGYAALGHSHSSRSTWTTVLKHESTDDNVDSLLTADLTGRVKVPNQVYSGQMKYYLGEQVTLDTYTFYKYSDDGSFQGTEPVSDRPANADYPVLSAEEVGSDSYFRIFGGWFTDANCEAAADSENQQHAYAKFVDRNLMWPVYQLGYNLIDDDETNDSSTQLTMYAFVDSIRYGIVGFRVNNNDIFGTTYLGTNGVVTQFNWRDAAGETGTTEPVQYVATATRALSVQVDNVSSEYFDDTYEVNCWWITQDGTYVESPRTTFCINSLVDQLKKV